MWITSNFPICLFNFLSKRNSFNQHLKAIQNAAFYLVKLQDVLKKEHTLNPHERKMYSENIEKISKATEKLAQMEEDATDMLSLYTGSYNTIIKINKYNKINIYCGSLDVKDTEAIQMQDHIKGIRSKIQEFGGFRLDKNGSILKPPQETIKVTTKKPNFTTKIPIENKAMSSLTINEKNNVSSLTNSESTEENPIIHDVTKQTIEVNDSPAEASIAEAKPIGGLFL